MSNTKLAENGNSPVNSMDGGTVSLTEADLCSLVHHGHLDGAAIRQGERQVLGVGELFLPDAPERHSVDEGHLQTVAPPRGFYLGLARPRQLAAATTSLEMPRLIWETTRKEQSFTSSLQGISSNLRLQFLK